MWNSTLLLDKYQYVKTNPYIIRIIGLLGIFTTLLMGYGLWRYARLETLYLIIFGPIISIFITNKLLRFSMQLFYPKFDIAKHEQFVNTFWLTHDEPSVDVFLPWAGEDLQVHEEVLKAVAQLDYKNVHVYMLDDVGSEEHKKLTERYGFHYLSRPNKGQYKKSGNLEFGYRHSNGEFILILDADFIPTKSSLRDLVPYIASDKGIGILQTPQYFEQTNTVHKRSKIEFGGGNIVEDFYRVVMPCRDEFKAAMRVGTSALYRRDAILKLQGTPKVHASEDLATGLLITQHGYYVKYLPLIESMGKSPETYQGYFKQHMRWCSGNLVFAKYWPTARLNLVARLMYITNPLYYLSEAGTVLFSFQFLFLLYFHANNLSLWNTLYFLPYIVLSRVLIPLTKMNKNKLGTRLAALSNSYTYFYTYIRMLFKGIPSWQPTGVKLATLHNDFVNAFDIGLVISAAYIILFVIVLVQRPFLFGNYNAYVVLAWAFYSVFWHSLFLTFVLQYIHPIKIATLQSNISKMFFSMKTHSISFLSFTLIGCSLFDTVLVAHTPKTPIALAFAQVAQKYNQYAPSSIISTPKAFPTPQAIGTHVKVKKIQSAAPYDFTVEKGDTLSTLATRAITLYASSRYISLNRKQLRYAISYVIQHEKGVSVKPGTIMEFDMNLLQQAVAGSEKQ